MTSTTEQAPKNWLTYYGKRALEVPKKMDRHRFALETAGRFGEVRKRAAKSDRQLNVGKYGEDSLFTGVDFVAAGRTLERDGIVQGLQLPQESIDGLWEIVRTRPCASRADRTISFMYEDRADKFAELGGPIIRADYLREDLDDNEALDRIAGDPGLRKIAATYLGAEPILTRHNLSWIFAQAPDSFDTYDEKPYELARFGSQTFHYDLYDYKSVSFFFYLTDCDETTGCHTFVAGTHRRKKLAHMLTLSRQRTDREVDSVYGADKVTNVVGPAGTGFATDASGFHKANVPVSADRLALRVRFLSNPHFVSSRPNVDPLAARLDEADSLGK